MALGFTGEIQAVERPEPDSVDVAADLRTHLAELITQQMERAREFRSYARVPDDELELSLLRHTFRVLAIIEDAPEPDPIVENERATALQRAAEGVVAEDVISLYRECTGLMRDAYIETAERLGVPNAVVIRKLAELWENSDSFTRVLADAWSYADADRARRAERARMEFLQRILLGTSAAADLTGVGSPLGITVQGQYWVFRARGTARELVLIGKQIESSARQPGIAPLLGPIDGDLVGICAVEPATDENWSIALAGPVRIIDMPHAFAEASRALAVAARFRRTGAVTTRSLGIKIAVASESELGPLFLEKYVTPVLASGAGGESILETVKVHLDSDCRYEVTAQAMFTHPNTVRNRLRRFQELTGVHFDDFERRLEIWWAIQYWQIAPTDAP